MTVYSHSCPRPLHQAGGLVLPNVDNPEDFTGNSGTGHAQALAGFGCLMGWIEWKAGLRMLGGSKWLSRNLETDPVHILDNVPCSKPGA